MTTDIERENLWLWHLAKGEQHAYRYVAAKDPNKHAHVWLPLPLPRRSEGWRGRRRSQTIERLLLTLVLAGWPDDRTKRGGSLWHTEVNDPNGSYRIFCMKGAKGVRYLLSPKRLRESPYLEAMPVKAT